MEITSAHNPLLQKIRKAAREGQPMEEGYVVAEGPHLLEEALRGAWRIGRVVTTPAGRSKYAALLQQTNAELVQMPARAFESIAATQHSQEILALLEPRTWGWPDLTRDPALLVVLDGIQDPGNAGTIVRSAEAFGASGVVFLRGSARVANGKLLRASAGSIFRVPFLQGMPASEFLMNTQKCGLALYALQAHASIPVAEADLRSPIALVAGNEGSGISPELLRAAQPIAIPTVKVDSLNAAVACSVALFAARQQRSAS